MLDIQLIRQDPEGVRQALLKRMDALSFDELLAWDADKRALMTKSETLKAERNRMGKLIPQMKKNGEDTTELLGQMKESADSITQMDAEIRELDAKIKTFMDALPNIPDESVVAGDKESNQVVRVWGEKPDLGDWGKDHMTLSKNLGLIDYERGVKLGGNGFWLYTDRGAMLEWALLNFFITEHIKDGYSFMLPPHMLTYECGYTAGQFPKFQDDVFRLNEEGFHFMLPTAETALVNLYRDEIVDEAILPRRMFAYTPCYRREAGSYRAGERGMIRGHQFNKVEMFAFTRPEESAAMHEELIAKAERIVQGLGLHYQLSKLAAKDVSASMATTFDIELWLPSMNEYKEVSSISNAKDYQARRGNMRFRRTETRRTEYMHTLNGSGMATSRLFPGLLEQHQQPDGSVVIPEALRPFMGGMEVLEPIK